MSKIQQWSAIAAVGILAVLAAGWFLAVSPQRAHAAKLHTQTVAQRSQSAGLRTELNMLKAQSKQLPAKQAELAKFGRQVPSNPALPRLIRSLTKAADYSGVDLVTIAPSPPVAVIPTVAAAPATLPASGAKTGTATTTTTVPVTASPVAPAVGLQSIPLTLKVTGTYFQLEQFVANLEGLQRILLVNGYSLAPNAASTGTATASSSGCTARACRLQLDITSQVFVAPALAAPPVTPTAK